MSDDGKDSSSSSGNNIGCGLLCLGVAAFMITDYAAPWGGNDVNPLALGVGLATYGVLLVLFELLYRFSRR